MLKVKFWAVKTDLWHPCYSFLLYARAALAWTKTKCSLRCEKLKANRASETEEQIKERLRIRRENEKIENHEKQRLAALKRLKRGDDNELKINLSLEKVVAGKQFRLAVETKEERRTRLENDLFWKVGNYAYHSNLTHFGPQQVHN